jgi:predicted nucleotidyltransferase
MNPRVPEAIRPMLQAYLDLLDRELPNLIAAVYLHGSIALDAFDEQRSDIDIVAVMAHPASADEAQKLAAVHQTIAQQYPRWLLEGSYLLASDLGKPETEIAPHPTYHDNQFNPAGQFDSNPVTWWVLKNKGVAVRGDDPQTLPYTVDWDALLTYMHSNMNSYWASFATNPTRIVRNLSDEGVAWTVLGILRQYYTFRENDITSKIGAGEYALQHVPAEWHNLVQDALDIRQGRKPTHYSSRFTRAYAVMRFVRYIVGESNKLK